MFGISVARRVRFYHDPRGEKQAPREINGVRAVMARAYLDWNATAPLRPQARAAMLEACELPGNPSSVHAEGRAARALVERAREEVAALVGGTARQGIFTSGATQANMLALSPPIE